MVERRPPTIDLQPVLDELRNLTAAVGRLTDRVSRTDARVDETVQGLARLEARVETLSNRVGSIAAASQETDRQLETVTRAMDHMPAETAEKVRGDAEPKRDNLKHWTIGGVAVIVAANWKNVASGLQYVGQILKGLPPPPTGGG